MHLTLVPASGPALEQVRALYLEAFPKEERKPFSLLLEKEQEGVAEILSLTDGETGEFLGLAITIQDGDLVVLSFFATLPKRRGGGLGAQALALLRERYPGRRFFLEIETTRKPSSNHALRLRRKNFYLRNGLREAGFSVMLLGVEMEVLTDGSPLRYEEYIRLYRNHFSEGYTKRIWKVEE